MDRAFHAGSFAKSYQRMAVIAGLFVVVSGVTVLIAWLLRFDAAKSLLPGLATMKFNTALGFSLAGRSLCVWGVSDRYHVAPRIAGTLALLVALLGLATLVQYLFDVDLRIDEFVIPDARTPTADGPGRMSIGTAVCFAFAGLALLSGKRKLILQLPLGQAFAGLTMVMALAGLLGYAFSVSALYSFAIFSSMAVHTAFLFVVLATGIFCLRPDAGFTAVIANRRLGGQLARVLLPAVLILPLLLGWVCFEGVDLGWYDTGFAFALTCLSSIVLLAALVLAGSASLNRMQSALEERSRHSAHLAAIVEGSDDAIVSTRMDGIVQSWNAGAERLYGYSAEEMLGEHVSRIVPPDLLAEGEQLLATIARGERIEQLETVRLTRDGKRIDLSLNVAPIRDERGQLVGVSKLARDISERKRSEWELRQRTDDLARSNKDLEQFAYVASHDLQEPLRAVSGCMQLLKRRYEGSLDERADEFIQHAVDGASRMQQLIDDLLRYSRAGRVDISIERVDCNELLQAALNNLAKLIRETNATVDAGELPTLPAVRSQLTLVFQNLIGNAIKFRRKDIPAMVSVEAVAVDDGWEFAVKDNGIGIDEQYFDRIFVIFQRLHTRREYAGTGIGLALCKKIVEFHGGRIWIESKEQQGTTVRFTLAENVANVPQVNNAQ